MTTTDPHGLICRSSIATGRQCTTFTVKSMSLSACPRAMCYDVTRRTYISLFNSASSLKQAQLAPEPESGRGPKSVQVMEKGGHMFVQTMPEPTARAVYNALSMCRTEVDVSLDNV